jgi:integrase
LTPAEYRRLIDAIPDQHRLMIQTAIETGLRWGELSALRPRHLDFEQGRLTVAETIVEVPLRAAPGGERMIVSPTPRTTNPASWASPPSSSTNSLATSPNADLAGTT